METYNSPMPSYVPGQENPVGLIPPKKSLLPKIIIAVVLAVIVIVGAFTIVLASRVWDPLWSPFRPSPEKVLGDAFKKMTEVNSLYQVSDISLAGEFQSQKASVFLKVEGDSKTITPGNIDFDEKVKLSVVSPGMEVSISGGLKKIGEAQYGKIDSFPAIFSMFLPSSVMGELGKLENKWIKVDSESINKMMQASAGVNGTINNEVTQKSEELQKEIKDKVLSIFKNNQLYLVDKQFPDEKINDSKVYHYQASLNQDGFAKAITEILKAIEEAGSQASGATISYVKPEGTQVMIKEALNKVGAISADIWIGKKDNYVYRIKLDKEIDVAKLFAGADYGTLLNGANVKLSVDINCSKFNQPVSIQAPQDATPIEGILVPLIEMSIKDSAVETNLSYIDSQIYSYFFQKKTYYGITCKNLMVSPYCAEIKKIIGKDPIIRASKNYYCAYSELFSKENGKVKYICSGNYENRSYTGTINPGLKGYCDGKTFMCPIDVSPLNLR
jgi:hypothetical protein